jgi:hypothetical protein
MHSYCTCTGETDWSIKTKHFRIAYSKVTYKARICCSLGTANCRPRQLNPTFHKQSAFLVKLKLIIYKSLLQSILWCSLCIESFIHISEQTATFALYIINWMVFITVVETVYSAVRTDWLHKADLQLWWKVFTARYGLIPYIKQITFRP